jgi:GH35 family endo-1,4-beta-xylanase
MPSSVTDSAPPAPSVSTLIERSNLLGAPWGEAFQPAPSGDARFERTAPWSDAGPGWRVATLRPSLPPNTIRLAARLAAPVSRDDAALIRIEARATRVTHETAEAVFCLTVQNHGGLFFRCAEARFSVGAAWRVLHLPFRFGTDLAAGGAEFILGFGEGEQVVELRDVSIVGHGPEVTLSDLPWTRATYAGRSSSAPWRAEAEARIRAHRQGELRVRVCDPRGIPVPGARVEARLRSHAFEFGTCIPLKFIRDDSPDCVRYREVFLDLFNAACPENDLKWARWIGASREALPRERVLDGLRWLRDHRITVRGHVFLWPSWKHLPPPITRLRDTPGDIAIPGLVREHIADIATATRDLVKEWDVVNEPFNHNDLMTRFGDDIMADWFRTARDILPRTPLYLNDWGTHDIDSDPGHVAHFTRTARRLLNQGAPLGGLGLQSHIGGIPCPPDSLLRTLDHYATNLDLPVRITEFDMAADDESLQADYLRDFYTAVFSHPSTVGIQMWGFWAGEHWWPSAALYRSDWSEKPNARALRTLLKQTWHTEAAGTTDHDGAWRTRGFHGDYDLVVTLPDGRRVNASARLAPGPNATEVAIRTA